MTNWIQRTREKARTHFQQGKAVKYAVRNPYKTEVMLPVIIVLLVLIVVGIFVIKAGTALLVGKKVR